MDRRRKRAPEGPQAGVDDKKGKKKERAPKTSSTQDHGVGPLEIAYGPMVGTHPKITEDDFKVDTGTGSSHKPQENAEGGGQLSPGQLHDDESPVREESGQWDRRDEDDSADKSVQIPGSGAEEFQNVWGK